MQVKQLCTTDVVTVDVGSDVVAAAQCMRTRHVGDVVVVKREDCGRIPVGIVTDRDLAVGVVAQEIADPRRILVDDLVSSDVLVVEGDDDVMDAMRAMLDRRVRRAPVVNALGVLVGILSYDDVLGYLTGVIRELSGLPNLQQFDETRRRTDHD